MLSRLGYLRPGLLAQGSCVIARSILAICVGATVEERRRERI